MTGEEVMFAGGGEISDSGDSDRIKIKGEHRNGVAHEDSSVGGAISGDESGEVTAVSGGDSGDLDLVIVEKVEGKALGESGAAVSEAAEDECECGAVNNKENDCEEKIETINGTISVGGDDQNDEGSVVVLDVSVDKKDANDANEIHDFEFEVQNGSENEICDGVDVDNAVDANGIQQNGEVCGDDSSFGSYTELESVAVENCLVSKETEVLEAVDAVSATADVKECTDEDGQSNSAEKAPQIESGDSGGDDIEKEWENVAEGTSESVSNGVSDEKEVVNREFESVVNGDVQNGLADTEMSECGKKDEIPVGVDGISAATDVKECEAEDARIGSDVEKPKVETVSDSDVDKSIVGAESADIQNGLAKSELTNEILSESEMGCKLEKFEEETGQVLVWELQDSLALNSTNEPGDGDVVSDVNENTVICEAEPSNVAAEREAEPSKTAGENEAEPSNIAVENEAEPSNNVVENEAEPSNIAAEREAEPSKIAGENEAQPPNIAESEAEPSKIEAESQAEPSKFEMESEAELSKIEVKIEAEPANIAVENEAELESEPSDIVVENEAEPSKIAVKSEAEPEAEPSNIVVENEVEPSNIVVENEAEPSNIAVEKEAEPSSIAVEKEAEPSNIAVENDDEPSSIAMENEAEASAEGELSVERDVGCGGDEMTKPTQEGSNTDALDGQNMGSEVVKKPFYYCIRLPRYDDDENIKEQIRMAIHHVEEKTKNRDAIRAESQTLKASCKEYGQEFRALISAERAARDLLKSKRQEMDSVQSTMNRLNNAISVGDIDIKIRNMEHMIEHETLPLKEEKQLIRQIKQLKQNREELSSSMAKQNQSQQSLDHKDSIEESMKQLQLLKKEMELLRGNVLKAEAATKAAKKKYDDQCNKLNEISARFKAADDIRQEAYSKLLTLRKQLHEKNKYFWEYKNASKKAQDLAAEGQKEELQCFCVDQVDRIMELWNKNDEFRKDYVRCNTRSTLRRLQTLDGRSLGPDEEPPVIPPSAFERGSRNNSLISHSAPQQEKKSTSTESVNTKPEPVNTKPEPVSKVAVQKSENIQTTKAKKPAKPIRVEKSVAPVSRWADEPEDTPEEPVRTKEEEERILKAEKARKEEEEAKLKEKRRIEEIEKAKEAMLRKKRNAEKAQQRAALKAQKEAEQKEKEREKKARKKEKRKAASTETADNTEQESAPVLETVARSIEESDQSEKPAEVTKRPQKPSQFTRQTKAAKLIPLPLRNRGKKRIQPWMWALIAVLAAVALFYLGNNRSLRSWLQGSGY